MVLAEDGRRAASWRWTPTIAAKNTKIATGTLATRGQPDRSDHGNAAPARRCSTTATTQLFPNQFVNARLLVEEKHGVTLVPNAVIQRTTRSTYVYVVKTDRTVTVRQITVGVTEGDDTRDHQRNRARATWW